MQGFLGKVYTMLIYAAITSLSGLSLVSLIQSKYGSTLLGLALMLLVVVAYIVMGKLGLK